jgi:hypothetical protein
MVSLRASKKAGEGFLPLVFRCFLRLKAIAAISITLWAPDLPNTPIFLKRDPAEEIRRRFSEDQIAKL